MKTKVSILFWARKKHGADVSDPHHEISLYCRLTIKRGATDELNFATGLDTIKSNWQTGGLHGSVKGKTAHDRHINTQLSRLFTELTDIHADLERQGKPVTARAIYQLYSRDGATFNLEELYTAFLAERKKLIGIEISLASYEVTVWRQRLLHSFLEEKKLLGLRPEEFTHNLADKFMHWCLADRGYKRNYANKALQVIVQCLRWGVRREHLDKNPMELYEYKAAARAEIKYLTVGEVNRLLAWQAPTPGLDKVRDCFVFQCFTGLACADLQALDMERDAHYRQDSGGTLRRILHITRAKSTLLQGYECVIPLLPEAERILAKYNDRLPVPGNQLYNRQLKIVGEHCGFPADKMTTHVGRKTAGVMMLNLGIRMETVSKFLGHSSVKMTEKIYAKILDTTVVDDFSKVFAAAATLAAPVTPAYALPEPPSGDSRWHRPPPTTSYQAERVVPMWAEPTTRKEVVSCG